MKVYAIFTWVRRQPLLRPPLYSSRERAEEVRQNLSHQAELTKGRVTYSIFEVEVEE
jgi:hypothetical protein